jgi:hypothetical protein
LYIFIPELLYIFNYDIAALDDERLKGNGDVVYWKELLDRIRDIRSSEKVLYRQVLDLYSTSVDDDPTKKVPGTNVRGIGELINKQKAFVHTKALLATIIRIREVKNICYRNMNENRQLKW